MAGVAPGQSAPAARQPAAAPLEVSHVADFYRRYPGETVTLYTRVDVRAPIPGFVARISLADGLAPGAHRASANHGEALPEMVVVGGARYMTWTEGRALRAGERYEYQVEAKILPAVQNLTLESQAVAITRGADGKLASATDSVEIAVSAKGRYLKHLPRLYQEQDELMGRFVMLFESFWAPIEGQIDGIPNYLDPQLIPSELLPWLASWVDLTLDERWPEEKRRQLLRSAVALYRRRGTRRGLQEYLEIYTGGKVKITERGAYSLRLGPQTRLGPGVALGSLNSPHSFTVTVFLPADAQDTAVDPAARARHEAERRRMVETIIEAEKPAHTSYTLHIETVTPDSQIKDKAT